MSGHSDDTTKATVSPVWSHISIRVTFKTQLDIHCIAEEAIVRGRNQQVILGHNSFPSGFS